MADIKFRRATSDDLAFLLNLRKSTMNEHLIAMGLFYTDADHRERIFDHFEDSLIIYHDDHAVGLLKLAMLPDRYHIRQFQILPAFQQQGIGTQVLTKVLAMAVKKQKDVTLNVLKKNPARLLYQRAGFKIVSDNDIEYHMRCYVK